jgi:hypothetical protein
MLLSWVSGCAGSAQWQNKGQPAAKTAPATQAAPAAPAAPAATTAPKTAAARSVPPTPAPALYIPAPPQPLAQEKTESQASPLQQIDLKDSKVAALPPLVPIKVESAEAEPAAAAPLVKMHALYKQAAQKVASMDAYILRLTRREVVNGKQRPEELILLKFRKEPYSVYLKWLGKEAQNREAVYVEGRYGNLIHTKMAPGDFLFMAGKRVSVAPDSPLARSNSRHPITEAGLARIVAEFGRILHAVDKGNMSLGTLEYLGVLKRPEFDTQVEGVMQVLPRNADPQLPGGGQRLWFFDIDSHLPVLIITHDEHKHEVEYYCHDRIQFPVALTDRDFDPDKLWGRQ